MTSSFVHATMDFGEIEIAHSRLEDKSLFCHGSVCPDSQAAVEAAAFLGPTAGYSTPYRGLTRPQHQFYNASLSSGLSFLLDPGVSVPRVRVSPRGNIQRADLAFCLQTGCTTVDAIDSVERVKSLLLFLSSCTWCCSSRSKAGEYLILEFNRGGYHSVL